MIRYLDRRADTRTVLIACVVAVGALVAANVFATCFYGWTGGHGLLDTAGGRNVLDDRPGYTPETAYALIAAWGPAGRRQQLLFTTTGDLLLPFVVFVFATLTLRYATRRLALPDRLGVALLAVPIGYLLSDYLENAGIVTLVLGYPTRLDALVTVMERIREAKDATGTATLLIAFGAFVTALAWRRSAAVGGERGAVTLR